MPFTLKMSNEYKCGSISTKIKSSSDFDILMFPIDRLFTFEIPVYGLFKVLSILIKSYESILTPSIMTFVTEF